MHRLPTVPALVLLECVLSAEASLGLIVHTCGAHIPQPAFQTLAYLRLLEVCRQDCGSQLDRNQNGVLFAGLGMKQGGCSCFEEQLTRVSQHGKPRLGCRDWIVYENCPGVVWYGGSRAETAQAYVSAFIQCLHWLCKMSVHNGDPRENNSVVRAEPSHDVVKEYIEMADCCDILHCTVSQRLSEPV